MTMTSITLKVTREDSLKNVNPAPGSAPSGDYLTPHAFAPRNSLSGTCGKYNFLGKFFKQIVSLVEHGDLNVIEVVIL